MSSRLHLGIRCDHFLSMAAGEAIPQRDIFVGIKDGKIAEVSPWTAEAETRCDQFIDARNQVVLPGLINGHTHLAMTLFRGLEDDVPFHQWLFERILPLEAKLVDREFVRVGTELAALECIRFGVTTVCDMYFYADQIADVIDRAGLRALVSQVFAAGPLPEDRELGTDKAKLFEQLRSKYAAHPRITPMLGPHAPYTCDDVILKKVAQISEQTGAPVTIHLSETEHEVQDSFKEHGKTPVKRLYDLGLLQRRAICAHGVHLDEADQALIKKSGAAIVYNPDSNLKLSSGIAPIARYLADGVQVAFGTDGSASNNDLSLFGAMDVGTKLQKLANHSNTAMVAAQALKCATWGGAHALGLGDRVGSIEVGKEADLICVDLDFPHMQPVHDVRSQLVYAAQGLEVDTVICRGQVLMRGKKIRALNSSRIMEEVAQWRTRIQSASGG